jgi:hypothetical protein
MRKFLTLLSIIALTACGGGTTTEPPKPQIVKLSVETLSQMPPPFVTGPNPDGSPSGPFVAGPGGVTPVVVGPTPVVQLPFVIGPVSGPVVTLTPPVVIGPSIIPQPVINYCTNGFIVGPCTPLPTTCKPDTPGGFVTGPCS